MVNTTGHNKWTISRDMAIALLAVVALLIHLILLYGLRLKHTIGSLKATDLPLIIALILGGIPLVFELGSNLLRREFSSDILAGLSIVTSVILGEYTAGVLVVLMLSGGQALENYAVRSASSVLNALARRMPTIAHRKQNATLEDVPLSEIHIGDTLVVYPHEICPVDGVVVDGHGAMDESYLTGEPYVLSKVPGSVVFSGSINGEAALTIRSEKEATDSRYAKIMQVMRDSEQRRPQIRRLGDQLGAVYTPIAILIAIVAWLISGEPHRFLAVLVVATPCPLLIGIPVAIIGSVSLAARRGIIIKDPAVLEKIGTCQTALFDKTGTLTYGKPRLTELIPAEGYSHNELLRLIAGLERYSRHPLALAVLQAAEEQGITLPEALEVSERPGEGLRGTVSGNKIQITGRKKLQHLPEVLATLPPLAGGMECVVLIEGRYAGVCRFRDEPREESKPFIHHLGGHGINRLLLVSGDREAEVKHLAERVGINHVYFSQSPEEKLELVRKESENANTLFLGDGINDAPALAAATVGVAFGQSNDITAEAASVVIMDNSLQRVDELLHIGNRMRTIALQSAIGGMALSVIGMVAAAIGVLPPVAGAIAQELIDVVAVLNALRAAVPPKILSDY